VAGAPLSFRGARASVTDARAPRDERGGGAIDPAAVDLRTAVGSVALPSPVLTASGTAGHGAELGAYFDLGAIGAVVTKSLSLEPWPGNPAPRVHETPAGMLNSVGLQGPGVEAWRAGELPALVAAGARVVASIWGTTVDGFARAAEALRGAPIVAVEVNLSCPNTEHGGTGMFAQDAAATAEVLAATEACGVPRWAKLTANVTDLGAVAGAAAAGGAEAVVLVNTVLGLAVDVERRTYRLGSGERGGGLSGAAIHPVALRAVHDVHRRLPALPIVGVGGVRDAPSAVALLLAGASAVEVGTATFADPRAPLAVQRALAGWLAAHGEAAVGPVVGGLRPLAPPGER
jgi:dihydroorotate dehydrogenase (NAD+) catalytic subunit